MCFLICLLLAACTSLLGVPLGKPRHTTHAYNCVSISPWALFKLEHRSTTDTTILADVTCMIIFSTSLALLAALQQDLPAPSLLPPRKRNPPLPHPTPTFPYPHTAASGSFLVPGSDFPWEGCRRSYSYNRWTMRRVSYVEDEEHGSTVCFKFGFKPQTACQAAAEKEGLRCCGDITLSKFKMYIGALGP